MKILIVVDMQHDFVDGVLGSPEAREIVPNVAEKISQYSSDNNSIIIYTKDTHFEDYMETQEGKYLPVEHCIRGTWGWEIVPELVTDKNAYTVEKFSFGYEGFPKWLRDNLTLPFVKPNIESIELVGVCTSICVISNALILKSAFREIPLIVDSKCCACVSKETHEAALLAMKTCQIEVI